MFRIVFIRAGRRGAWLCATRARAEAMAANMAGRGCTILGIEPA